MEIYINWFILGLAVTCSPVKEEQKLDKPESIIIQDTNKPILNPGGKNIRDRFNPPKNYSRVESAPNSFSDYLKTLPLKPHGSLVHHYDGHIKDSSGVYVAVIDIDVGHKNLQQCADAIMRMRAEYLYKNKEYDKIQFNFVNGFNATYSKWVEGYRIKIKGNDTWWEKTSIPGTGYDSFREYLEWVFMYAGTASLYKELDPVEQISDIRIGDLFIKGGSPGHAVLVVDLAVHKDGGKKIFLLVQSYMPAQDIQILINPNDSRISPWYKVNDIEETLVTPEWTFSTDQLMRFPD